CRRSLKVNFLKEKLPNKNRAYIFVLALILFWAKTMLAYYIEFNLGVSGVLQMFILWINPFATLMILLSFCMYFNDTKNLVNFIVVSFLILIFLLTIIFLYFLDLRIL